MTAEKLLGNRFYRRERPERPVGRFEGGLLLVREDVDYGCLGFDQNQRCLCVRFRCLKRDEVRPFHVQTTRATSRLLRNGDVGKVQKLINCNIKYQEIT